MANALPCPSCRKKVSAEDATCPECGHLLAGESRRATALVGRPWAPLAAVDRKLQARREATGQTASLAAVAAAALLAGLVVTCTYFTSEPAGAPSAVTDERDVDGAWAYMQLFVMKRLKSPSSADFPFGGSRHVTPLGGGRYKVDSYVDAQNSFGAQLRRRFEGVIKTVQGGWELESLRFEG